MTFDEPINQVSEVNIELILASFRDGRTETPEDRKDENNLHVDCVHFRLAFFESGDIHDSGEELCQTPEQVKLAELDVKWIILYHFQTTRNKPFKEIS